MKDKKEQISLNVEQAYIDSIDNLKSELNVTSRNEVVKRLIHMTDENPEDVIAESQKVNELDDVKDKNNWDNFREVSESQKVEIVKDEITAAKKDKIKNIILENTDYSSSYSYQVASSVYDSLHRPIGDNIDDYWYMIVEEIGDDKNIKRNVGYYKSELKRMSAEKVINELSQNYGKRCVDKAASETISRYNIRKILEWLVENNASSETISDVITKIRLHDDNDFDDDKVKQMIDEEINKVK